LIVSPPFAANCLPDEQLAPFTWFRVGGPADVLFLPKDEAILRSFSRNSIPSFR
jgi:UDP-N-acetylmuramate dehydrogenase